MDNEELLDQFFDILDEEDIDFEELGLNYDDLEDLEEDELNFILDSILPDNEDDEEEW
jgi:hypothetical protein